MVAAAMITPTAPGRIRWGPRVPAMTGEAPHEDLILASVVEIGPSPVVDAAHSPNGESPTAPAPVGGSGGPPRAVWNAAYGPGREPGLAVFGTRKPRGR